MLNSHDVVQLARQHITPVSYTKKDGWFRHDIVKLLNSNENIGIELGVAKGIYSKRMLSSGKFSHFYGVDIYGDTHNTDEYCNTIKYIGIKSFNYSLFRMDFDSANKIFPDGYFDFIYIDGFAHTGEEGGKTIIDWYKKLKVGGILAGDDYHDDWPLVVWAVNDFVSQIKVPLNITDSNESTEYSLYPSWFIIKNDTDYEPSVNMKLFDIAMREKERIHRIRTRKRWTPLLIIRAVIVALGLKPIALKIKYSLEPIFSRK